MPFRALRPAASRSADVAAPPYDVVNRAEARTLAAGRPYSFLRVSRAEIELPDDTDPYDKAVYHKARENLEQFITDGVLQRDDEASYYVYRISTDKHQQTGVAFAASIAAYQSHRIKRHEHTRPAKETDRVRQIHTCRAQTGPVLLIYRTESKLKSILATITANPPDNAVPELDGARHEIWRVSNQAQVTELQTLLNQLPALYIADGHHRSAAAARVADEMALDPETAGFLAVAFPHDEVEILDYNRLVKDLGGRSTSQFLNALQEVFEVRKSPTTATPIRAHQFGMYLDGNWYELTVRNVAADSDPVAQLDVHVLDQLVLRPLLGIEDPRTDDRIDFVGGSRGPDSLTTRVDSGEMAIAFMLHPTPMSDLLAVADASRVMPPKSTWFDPKLADGLLSLSLD